MKKIIFTGMIALIGITVFSQEAESKKVQAGLVFGAGVNFQTMNTKNIQTNGVGSNLSLGAAVNVGFTNNIGLATGLELDIDNMKYKSNGTDLLFYRYNDNKILRGSESANATGLFNLKERKQQAMYLTIPTMIVFRTNYIGYFRYYGKIGLRNSFLLTSKSSDKGANFNATTLAFEDAENKDMKMGKGNDMLFYKGSAGIVFGTEWNFINTTCLALEVGYYYGFTPLYYENGKNADKRTIFKNIIAPEYITNAARQSQLLFKLSVLF